MDTFIFVLVDGKGIVPGGAGSTADCKKGGYGFGCTAKVLEEGKISY